MLYIAQWRPRIYKQHWCLQKLLSIISSLSSLHRLKVIPKLYKFNFLKLMSNTTMYTSDTFYFLCMCSILFLRGFHKTYIMLELSWGRLSIFHSLLCQASLLAFTLKTKVLQLQKFWKITGERNQWHFQERTLYYSLQLEKFPNASIVSFNLIVSWNNTVIITYAPTHLDSFLCKNSAGHFCLNGQFFMWKESSDNVLLNKTGLFHDSLRFF